MTDVLDGILNGGAVEREEESCIDETTAGEKAMLSLDEEAGEDVKEADLLPPGGADLEDTTDSVSSQPGAQLVIALEEDEKEEDQLDGDDTTQPDEDDDEASKLDMIDAPDGTENGDSMMEIVEDGSNGGGAEDHQQSSASMSPQVTSEGGSSKPLNSFKNTLPKENGLETTAGNENSSSSSTGEASNKTKEGATSSSSSSSKKTSQPRARSFAVSDGNAIAKELQEQIKKLNSLLSLKEKEWSAILRLKKHMEYAMEQVKCTQRMAKAEEELNGTPMTTNEIKDCIQLITESGKLNLTEKIITESIESAENENESLQAIFPFRGGDSPQGEESSEGLSASAALQKLCERKRKASDVDGEGESLRTRRFITGRDQSSLSRKVFGPKGHMVNVQSIIETHRSGGQKPQKLVKKSALQMNPERSYYKTLEELISIAKADKEPSSAVGGAVAASVPQISCTRTTGSSTAKPKNGKPAGGRQSSNSLLISNAATPSGSGTLAKMLSPSTHSNARSINDGVGPTNSSQRAASKLPTSDGNLSLANLLATSKMDGKPNSKNVKKERVREEDASHLPAGQQADTIPICQGCNLSRAQFVCAGCANQWYCSRECQVAAWDEHSEICSG